MKVHNPVRKAEPRKWPVRPLAWAGGVLGVLALGWFVALPAYVRAQAERAFAAKGVRVELPRPRIGLRAVHFASAKLRFDAQPWLRADLTDVDVALDGLTPSSLRAGDAQLFVEAPLSDVPEEPGPSAPIPVSLPHASVRWTAPVADVSQADILDLAVEIKTNGDIDAQNGKLSLATAKGPMGPWDLSYARTKETRTDRITVSLDGPRARWLRVRDPKQTLLHFTAEQSKPKTWGVPNLPPWMSEAEPRIDATLTETKGGTTATTATTATTTGHLELRVADVKLPELPRALDLAVLVNVSELPKKRTYRIDRGTLALGNIVGGIEGTMDGNLVAPSADLVGTFRNVSCAAIAADLAPNEGLRMLGGLAQTFGVDAGKFEADARIKVAADATPAFALTIRRACLPVRF